MSGGDFELELRRRFRGCAKFRTVDKTIKRYSSLSAMKADEYQIWQRLPPSERIRAVMDLTLGLYTLKGQAPDAPRLQRTLVRIQRGRG